MDERHWQNLNKSLHRISSTTNGKYDAVPEIAASFLPSAFNFLLICSFFMKHLIKILNYKLKA